MTEVVHVLIHTTWGNAQRNVMIYDVIFIVTLFYLIAVRLVVFKVRVCNFVLNVRAVLLHKAFALL